VLFPCVLALLCLLLFLWRLGAVPLKDFDEAYYAVGAKEMLERHDLGTPYFNGRPFLLKPILIYWVIAASFRAFGTNEFAARLPSAFWGGFVVLFIYWFGARTVNRRAGFLAGLFLALSYMWMDIARDASIDALLVALFTPALCLIFLSASSPARNRRLFLLAYPLLGLALLAKGPVPTAVVLIGLAAYLAAAGGLGRLLRRQALPGLALTLLVAAPWYVYELRHQPDFFATFFIGEHFGHLGGSLARQEPWWGNLKYLVIYLWPWAPFLPGAVAHALHRPRNDVLRFALWWAVMVVALFSIPRSKLAHYLAPAFPPLALMLGAWIDSSLRTEWRPRWALSAARVGLAAVALACLALAFAAFSLPPAIADRISARYGAWTPGPAPGIMLLALGVGAGIGSLLAGARPRALVPVLAVSMAAACIAHIGWFRPRLAQIEAQPRKELALFAADTLPSSEPLGVYYAKRNSTIFYLGRPIVDLGETEADFARVAGFLSEDRPRALLTHRKFLARLERQCAPLHVLAERGDYVLIANHPTAVVLLVRRSPPEAEKDG